MAITALAAYAIAVKWSQKHLRKRVRRIETGGKRSLATRIADLIWPPIEEPQKRRIFVNEPLAPEYLGEDGLPLQEYPENKVRTTKYTAWDFVPKDLALQFMNVANCYFLFIIVLGAFQIFGVQSPGMQAVPLIVIVVLTACKDGVEDFRRAKSDHEMNTCRVHGLSGLDNPNVVARPPTLTGRLGNALSEWVWGVTDKIESSVSRRRAKKDKKKAAKRGGSGSGSSGSSPGAPHVTAQAGTPATAGSTPQIDDAYSVQSLEPSMVDVATQVSGVGSLVELNSTTTKVPGTGKVSPFIDGTITNPNVVPTGKCHFHGMCWQDIRVGDIIRVRESEEIPCDVVVLSSSDPKGLCFVETKNLDGETNLKSKEAVKCGRGLRHASDFERVAFSVETEPPSKDLYKFRGVVRYRGYSSEDDHEGKPESEAVTYNNVLLRGCTLRNVAWALCVVVSTGNDTKIMLNSGKTPSKRSKISKNLNVFVIINFVLLFVMCFVAGLINGLFYRRHGTSRSYFEYRPYAGNSPAANGTVDFFVNLILYQTLVPISLYITIEIIKAFQAFFIYSDLSMYYEELGHPCTPKSWTISDDLGQIEYVFSDKTGTLTQNVMEFKKCSVAGKQYGISYTDAAQGMDKRHGVDVAAKLEKMDKQISEDKTKMVAALNSAVSNDQFREDRLTFISSEYVEDMFNGSAERKKDNTEFALALALCHNVITAVDEEGFIEYKAESPDEAALVAMARDMGVVFREHVHDSQVVSAFGGAAKPYQILQTIPFNSTRKRMSVLIKNPAGEIVLYSKGADNVMYQRLSNSPSNNDLAAKTAIHLGEFAQEGLRTLCVCKRVLGEKEFLEWHAKYLAESKSVEADREQKMEEISKEIETDLELLGGTAIEDRLQEGVPSTISLIRRAGIKLWVLTGDKVETAISIGFSCNLLANSMHLLVIKGDLKKDADEHDAQAAKELNEGSGSAGSAADTATATSTATDAKPGVSEQVHSLLADNFGIEGTEADLEEAKKDHGVPLQTFAVVVDGRALTEIMADDDTRRQFLLLCKQCSSVLCCRVSPAQKAEIVSMVKDGLGVMTLAIGDGANDVSMIQTANVGVGIAGKEGRQAAMSSDYSIGQFRYLLRMLLVHGRWAYRRFAEMIPCFFYKNVVFVFPLFWYGIFVNFDGTYLYEYSYLMLFNLFFTSVPVITMGCLDQDVNAAVSLAVPELYRPGITNDYWSVSKFFYYMLDGMYQSFICFFFTWFLNRSGVFLTANGLPVDHRFWFGVYTAHTAVLSCNTYVLFRQFRWDWLTLLFWVLSILFMFFWTGIWTAGERSSTVFYKAAPECYGSLSFWVNFAVGVLCCMLPRIVYDTIRTAMFPNDSDVIREQVRQGKFAHLPEDYDPTLAKYAGLVEETRQGEEGEEKSSYAPPERPVNSAPRVPSTIVSSLAQNDSFTTAHSSSFPDSRPALQVGTSSGAQHTVAAQPHSPTSPVSPLVSRARAFSGTIKRAFTIKRSNRRSNVSPLARLKAEMERAGQSSTRSSLEGIRTSSDIGISSPANLMRVYTEQSQHRLRRSD